MQLWDRIFNSSKGNCQPPKQADNEPNTVPTTSTGTKFGGDNRGDNKVSFGFSTLKGKRASMEDFYEAKFYKDPHSGKVIGLFGVFDGHGGPNAASFVKDNLFDSLLANKKFNEDNIEGALIESFTETDSKYLDKNSGTGKDDGCTAVTAILVDSKLYIANVGDSRAVLSRRGEAYALSVDHKPNNEEERKRIENLGGVVVWAGTWRVGGVLAVSRAFGDRLLKKYVIPTPYTQREHLTPDDEVAILASDGLWDVISNQDAIKLIKDIKDAVKAAQKLTDEAYSRGSNDNISCIVIRFNF